MMRRVTRGKKEEEKGMKSVSPVAGAVSGANVEGRGALETGGRGKRGGKEEQRELVGPVAEPAAGADPRRTLMWVLVVTAMAVIVVGWAIALRRTVIQPAAAPTATAIEDAWETLQTQRAFIVERLTEIRPRESAAAAPSSTVIDLLKDKVMEAAGQQN